MDSKDTKQLDDFIEKIMDRAPLDEPSADFTERLMDRVKALPRHSIVDNKPLLSGKVLFALSSLFFAVLLYLGSIIDLERNKLWEKLNINAYLEQGFTWIPEMEFSKTLVYGMVFFTLMLFLQIPLLKRYFDRRLA